jgi:hypothetical protein
MAHAAIACSQWPAPGYIQSRLKVGVAFGFVLLSQKVFSVPPRLRRGFWFNFFFFAFPMTR